ncbi:MAG: aldo/keto reductase [Bilophila wadsworthia]
MRILPGNGIRLVAWGPLFRGKLMQHPAIVEIAAAHGKTPGQIILRWHIQKGHIAIPKSSNESRIHENGDVFSFILTPGDMDRIDALDCGEHIGDDPYTFTGIK